MSYCLRDVVADGCCTAPRWFQHWSKLSLHATVTFAIFVMLEVVFGADRAHLVAAALVGGPVLFLLLVGHEVLWPSDPQPLTRWQHIADWMTDGALATAPLALALLVVGPWLAGVSLLALCAVAYLVGHRDARP